MIETKFILFFMLFLVATIIFSAFMLIHMTKWYKKKGDLNLYYYQWYLHGKTNLYIDENVLDKNYSCMPVEEAIDIIQNGNKLLSTMSNIETLSDDNYVKEIDEFHINFEKASNLYRKVFNKKNVIVAIIDSGVDINHSELKDSIWVNEGEIPDNNIDDDNNGYIDDVNGYNFYSDNNQVFVDEDEDIHGTHSAGIIVAKQDDIGINGIVANEHIKIMPIKILGENGTGKVSNFLKAVEYAEKNGADICNVSLGSFTYNEKLDETVKNSKMLFVVAAGNGENYKGYNIDENKVYPASLNYDNVITVANISFDGSLFPSSNYGESVLLGAPGTFILSTIPNDKYGVITGTSMAAPFVTAVSAMMMSTNGYINYQNIKKILTYSVDTNEKLNLVIKTGGILNAYKAMQLANIYQEVDNE